MPDTVREQIISAFLARSQPLSELDVLRAQRSDTEIQKRFITLWDGEDTLIDSEFQVDTMQFPIALELQWIELCKNPSVSANAAIGEVRAIIESADRSFGDLAKDLQYQSATPEYPVDGSNMIALTLIYLISYSTPSGDPYQTVFI